MYVRPFSHCGAHQPKSLDSHLVVLGSSQHVLSDVPAPVSVLGNKTADFGRRGVVIFFAREKRALGSLSKYITIRTGWKGIKGFTEWMCHEMLRREHNRKQITHRDAGSACNSPQHRNNPERVKKKIYIRLEEKSRISVHGWETGRWKGLFFY